MEGEISYNESGSEGITRKPSRRMTSPSSELNSDGLYDEPTPTIGHVQISYIDESEGITQNRTRRTKSTSSELNSGGLYGEPQPTSGHVQVENKSKEPKRRVIYCVALWVILVVAGFAFCGWKYFEMKQEIEKREQDFAKAKEEIKDLERKFKECELKKNSLENRMNVTDLAGSNDAASESNYIAPPLTSENDTAPRNVAIPNQYGGEFLNDYRNVVIPPSMDKELLLFTNGRDVCNSIPPPWFNMGDCHNKKICIVFASLPIQAGQYFKLKITKRSDMVVGLGTRTEQYAPVCSAEHDCIQVISGMERYVCFVTWNGKFYENGRHHSTAQATSDDSVVCVHAHGRTADAVQVDFSVNGKLINTIPRFNAQDCFPFITIGRGGVVELIKTDASTDL